MAQAFNLKQLTVGVREEPQFPRETADAGHHLVRHEIWHADSVQVDAKVVHELLAIIAPL